MFADSVFAGLVEVLAASLVVAQGDILGDILNRYRRVARWLRKLSSKSFQICYCGHIFTLANRPATLPDLKATFPFWPLLAASA